MVAATEVAVPLARAARDALLAAARAVPPAVLLTAAATAAVVMAVARPRPVPSTSGRVTVATAIGLPGLLPVAPAAGPTIASRQAVPVAVALVSGLAEMAEVEPAAGVAAALIAAPVPVPTIPSAVVAAPQVVEAGPRTRVAPVRKAVPDVERDEALTVARVPPTGAPRDVGIAVEVLK